MTVMLEVMGVISGVGLILFFLLYFHNPASLMNGLLFDIEIVLLLVTLLLALEVSKLNVLGAILLILLILFAGAILLFGIWIVIGYLLFNAVQVLKRESHSLSNMLSLIIGLGLLFQVIIFFAGQKFLQNPVVLVIVTFLAILELWLAATAVCFITTSGICRLDRPRLNTDYIIVLGCGLLRGNEVSPLLGSRIDRAITFYKRAMAKGKHPKLLMSGGQGSDESIPESEAMKSYAIEHGIPEEDILIEKKSKTTFENFKFSKEVMDIDSDGRKYRCAYATSSYHVLRARIYARKTGLKRAKGLSARTARYYVTNATIREYIAVMMNNKKSSIVQLAVITICYAVLIWCIVRIGA